MTLIWEARSPCNCDPSHAGGHACVEHEYFHAGQKSRGSPQTYGSSSHVARCCITAQSRGPARAMMRFIQANRLPSTQVECMHEQMDACTIMMHATHGIPGHQATSHLCQGDQLFVQLAVVALLGVQQGAQRAALLTENLAGDCCAGHPHFLMPIAARPLVRWLRQHHRACRQPPASCNMMCKKCRAENEVARLAAACWHAIAVPQPAPFLMLMVPAQAQQIQQLCQGQQGFAAKEHTSWSHPDFRAPAMGRHSSSANTCMFTDE